MVELFASGVGFPTFAAGLHISRRLNRGVTRGTACAMSDTASANPPDRLSTDPDSPYYDADVLARNVGVRFKGEEKNNVDEYCVSEGWIRVVAGAAKDRRGKPLTLKLSGPVEPYFREG